MTLRAFTRTARLRALSVAAGLFLPAALPAAAAGTAVLSFEDGGIPADVELVVKNAAGVRVTPERAKYGAQSLRWDWRPGGEIAFRNRGGIAFAPRASEQPDNKLGTFVVWIYNTAALPGGSLRFEFGRTDAGGTGTAGDGGFARDCWFDFGLDFTGWRTCWVAYGRDMRGAPRAGMDTVRIAAPAAAGGTLFIDSLVFCQPIDARHHTRDAQVPFVNTVVEKQANEHWSALLRFDRRPLPDFPLPAGAGEAARTADARYASLLPAPAKLTAKKIARLAERFAAWEIHRLPARDGGGTTGRPVCYPHENDAYPAGSPELHESSSGTLTFAAFNQLLLDLALAFHAPDAAPAARDRLRDMFLACHDHMRDQGWRHGSAQGTVHHLGYTMRNYYTALYLMRGVLRETGRLASAQRDMAWFSGAGRACAPLREVNGESIDTLNTILPGQLAACLMLDDAALRARWLAVTSRWLGRALEPAAGIAGGIAPDGCVMHHCNHYPAYAVGGIQGAAEALWVFGNTPLRVPAAGHASLRRAMLNLRFHSNVLDWPLSLSGRHPTGKFSLDPRPYLFLALAGAPDGSAAVDAAVLAAWKRLDNAAAAGARVGTRPPAIAPSLADPSLLDVPPEPPPSGHLTLSHATAAAHRRAGWLVTARGFNRYLWGSEIYPGANMYGRYLAYGHVEILARGDPVNLFDSGYAQDGWDWNCWPGTTVIHLPPPALRDRVLNVDIHSGYEEMLLGDEAFAGGSNLENRNGVFAMKLHGHAKYDGSHRARKSVFFLDDRVILLGTGITNTDAAHATRTTLFQNHLADPACDAPPPPVRDAAGARLRDAAGNTYFVLGKSAADLRATHSRQHSRSQDDRRDTEGGFTLAWLDHGPAPRDAGYAYAILVQPDAAREADFARELAGAGGATAAPFAILRRDNTAHIVRDRDTGILAAACFEPVSGTGLEIAGVSRPSLIMMRAGKNKNLVLSVCDPDLHLYEGIEPDQLNPDGSQREVSIYSRAWIHSPGAPSVVRVTLEGSHAPARPDARIRRLPAPRDGQTVLEFTCRDGLPVETTLIPAGAGGGEP
jgi:chondroitin-sulfate-ABC endolyase/exolyase